MLKITRRAFTLVLSIATALSIATFTPFTANAETVTGEAQSVIDFVERSYAFSDKSYVKETAAAMLKDKAYLRIKRNISTNNVISLEEIAPVNGNIVPPKKFGERYAAFVRNMRTDAAALEYYCKLDFVSDTEKVVYKYLAEKICAGLNSDYEKAFAIGEFIAQNISYGGKCVSVLPIETLTLRYGRCAEFADLYRVLARSASLPTRYSTSEYAQYLDEEGYDYTPPPHAWNEVFADGRWIVLDSEWGDGFYEDGVFSVGTYGFKDYEWIREHFFDVNPETEIYNTQDFDDYLGIVFEGDVLRHFGITPNDGINSYIVPQGVKKIETLAFAYNPTLNQITIPASVTYIGEYAFYQCKNLEIYGESGSYAEQYARDNGITFLALGTPKTGDTSSALSVTPKTIDTSGASSWAVDNIKVADTLGLATSDLTNGYQAATTRAEFCRAAVNFLRQYGYDVDGVTPKLFADTSDRDIGIAASLGITSGTDTAKNLFSPNATLTREQAATMLNRLLGVIGKDVKAKSTAWTDSAKISSYAVQAIDVMYGTGVMGGTSSTALVFDPQASYTHEASIVTFVRLWDYVGK